MNSRTKKTGKLGGQNGEGPVADLIMKVAPALLAKIAEPIGSAVGSKIGEFIHPPKPNKKGGGTKLAGGGTKLAGKGTRLAGSGAKKKKR